MAEEGKDGDLAEVGIAKELQLKMVLVVGALVL